MCGGGGGGGACYGFPTVTACSMAEGMSRMPLLSSFHPEMVVHTKLCTGVGMGSRLLSISCVV